MRCVFILIDCYYLKFTVFLGEVALHYLSKNWSNDEATEAAHDDKNAYIIAKFVLHLVKPSESKYIIIFQ